jgi:alkylation response protein AidB-like acyl-CoA dehydrogenase
VTVVAQVAGPRPAPLNIASIASWNRQLWVLVAPPSTTYDAVVIHAARSESRKATTFATSSGRPTRRSVWNYRLAELDAELDLLRHYACAEASMRGDDTSRFATIAKLKAGRLQREVADTCVQFHGGVGYMEESWAAGYFRDARLLSIGGGADEVMLRVLARADGVKSD